MVRRRALAYAPLRLQGWAFREAMLFTFFMANLADCADSPCLKSKRDEASIASSEAWFEGPETQNPGLNSNGGW